MVRIEITSIFSFTPTYYLVKCENLVVKIAARYIKIFHSKNGLKFSQKVILCLFSWSTVQKKFHENVIHKNKNKHVGFKS